MAYAPSGDLHCDAPSQADIDHFTESMRDCFQYAADRGFSIVVTPHLDDGSK